MKLIVALGNPEPKYSWTRHNAGKEIINLYAEKELGISKTDTWQKFSNDIEYIESFKNVFIKPTTYMNILGEPIYSFIRYHKVDPKNILIIYDELDLIVGTYKLTEGKGSRIHNGLKSVEQYLDSKSFWHLRIGVRDPEIEMSVQKTGRDPARYLLDKLPASHKKQIIKLYDNSLSKVLTTWLSKE